jgi:hypothetical protein
LASEEGHGTTCQVLVENGGDLDELNQEQKTPIDVASPTLRSMLQQLQG